MIIQIIITMLKIITNLLMMLSSVKTLIHSVTLGLWYLDTVGNPRQLWTYYST